jgi:acyl-coenzyme A synthetase/AMP-(fatty) acid ligase
MPDYPFLYDYKTGKNYCYSRLLKDVNSASYVPTCCYTKDLYSTFLIIITAIINDSDLVLLDSGFSVQELQSLNVTQEELTKQTPMIKHTFSSSQELMRALSEHKDWELILYTSGTTGVPKQIRHKFASLIRAVRKAEKHENDVWGFAFNPTHIAGLQVFFQALLNGNSLINLFGADRETALSLIRDYAITNISATPTYYRLLLPLSETFPGIKNLTSGGEKFDANLAAHLAKSFPNARLRNVYASTEAGTILEANDDVFSIKDEKLYRIADGELLIHKSLLGEGKELSLLDDEWYGTGDIVELIEENPLCFRFLSRRNEMVNVGGYKVNPYEAEQLLETHPHIKQAYVYGKASAVLGNILMADVIATEPLTEKELRDFLSPLLQPYKTPRIINFVSSIELTRTGKLKRT